MEWFNLDFEAINARAMERGDIRIVRFPVRDFDPFDLRKKLPKAITKLAQVHAAGKGTLYIHCTAGTSRSAMTKRAAGPTNATAKQCGDGMHNCHACHR